MMLQYNKPWRVEVEDGSALTRGVFITCGNGVIAEMNGSVGAFEECKQRAHEIVRAVNMLDVMEEVIEALKLCQVQTFMANGSENAAYQKAKAVLARMSG